MSDSKEYVIARRCRPRFYAAFDVGFTDDIDRALTFTSVSAAVRSVGCNGHIAGEAGLTIHRVVREPARVEEVPLKEALNEGLPLVAVFTDRGGRDYLSAPGAGPGSMSRDIARAVRFDRITDMLRNCRPFDIVGVREVPGSVTTVEVA